MKIRSSKWTRDIHNNTYCKFLFFLITRFSKYICNQVPVKVTVTFIYLDCNNEKCVFCKISNDCVEIHLSFCHLLLTFLFTPPMKVDNHSLVGIHPFSIHDQSHYLPPWRNSYSQKHLLLFISRFTVTAKQIFLFFFLPSILFSFFFFLTIRYNIFLPFVRFLWSSIAIWFFDIRKDSYFFCSCQQKGALLHVLVTEVTTGTLKKTLSQVQFGQEGSWLAFLHKIIAIS